MLNNMDVHTQISQPNQNGKVESEIQSEHIIESEIDNKQHQKHSNSTFNPTFFGIIVIYAVTLLLEWSTIIRKHFWFHLWNDFLDYFGDNEFNIVVWGTSILTIGLYWIIGGVFVFMDVTNKPKFMRKYKIQLGTNETVVKGKLYKALALVLFNQFCVSVPMTVLAFDGLKKRGIYLRDVPSFPRILIEVYLCSLMYEVFFYYSHRLMHYKFLYKYVHKVHHQWTAPIAITAMYSHPVEHIFVNIWAVSAGTVIMGSHIIVFWLWISLLLLSTLGDHSGYHIPFLHSSEYHDFHHLKFNQCYGATGLMDHIHGTDNLFRKTINDLRHMTLYSLKSARERHPDNLKKAS